MSIAPYALAIAVGRLVWTGVSSHGAVKGVVVPHRGTHCVWYPNSSSQHERTQAHPGGHPWELVQVSAVSQNQSPAQKQQPSTVVKQAQQPLSPHVMRFSHTPQPLWMHAFDGVVAVGVTAEAVAAVSIEAPPSAAAPTPARLSNLARETRSSVTAIRQSSCSGRLHCSSMRVVCRYRRRVIRRNVCDVGGVVRVWI